MTRALKVLVTAPYFQPVMERFRSEFDEHGIELIAPHVEERLEEPELLALIHDVDGVISGDDRFTERVLRAAPRLKVISKWGTGIDSIDLDACRAQGVEVRNTPGAFTAPVADSILGYVLSFARRLPEMQAAMRSGQWQKIPGHSLSERCLGVVGIGNIGSAVTARAMAFGARVLGNDIREVEPVPGLTVVDLEELLRESDFVCVTCDLNPTSHRLFGERQFDLMRATAVLINLARGPIVDEQALIEALREGRIAGAALDVFEHEPLSLDNPLRSMDNVMLAPHNANSSPEAWERVHRNTIDNLLEVILR